MDKQRGMLWAGVVVMILIVGIIFFFLVRQSNPAANAPTYTAAPAGGVSVPNEGADNQNVAAGVAVPKQQVAALPGSSASFRSFAITVADNAYTPATVVVNQGDTVDLEITAADANYGFTQPDYGLNGSIPKGKTQRIQFQALQSGNFTFYCGSCGGPAKGPVGHIIVNAL